MEVNDFYTYDYIRVFQPLTIQQMASYLRVDSNTAEFYLKDLAIKYPIELNLKDNVIFSKENYDEICGIKSSEFELHSENHIIFLKRIYDYMKNANKFVSINEMFNYFRSKTNSSYSIETISNLLDKLIQFGIVKKITGNNTSYILTELISPNGEIKNNKLGPEALLIVGNGFDLHFDLKTSYWDFYNFINVANNCSDAKSFRKRYVDSIKTYDSPEFEKAFLIFKNKYFDNFFIRYFLNCFTTKYSWVAVENEIQKILVMLDTYLNEHYASSSREKEYITYSFIEFATKKGKEKAFFDRLLKLEDNDLFSVDGLYLNFKYTKAIESEDTPYELDERFKDDFPGLLYKSLVKFEQMFSYYLNYCLFMSIDRDENLFYGKGSYLSEKNIESVISYNYTKYIGKQFETSNIMYVHGRLTQDDNYNMSKENIIFGIDVASANFNNTGFNIFKKDYRRTEYDTDYLSISKSKSLDNKQCVIIYGHSIDKIDYDSLKLIINKCYENYLKVQKNHLKNPIETEERKLWKNDFEISIFYHSLESKRKMNQAIRDLLEDNFEELNLKNSIHFYPDCEDADKEF